jgi:hypothetical protein
MRIVLSMIGLAVVIGIWNSAQQAGIAGPALPHAIYANLITARLRM